MLVKIQIQRTQRLCIVRDTGGDYMDEINVCFKCSKEGINILTHHTENGIQKYYACEDHVNDLLSEVLGPNYTKEKRGGEFVDPGTIIH